MAPYSALLALQPILLAAHVPMPMLHPHPTRQATSNGSETLQKLKCSVLNRVGGGSTGLGRLRQLHSGVIRMVLLLVYYQIRHGTGLSNVAVYLIMRAWGYLRTTS
jgi:hypothetical protein